MQVEKILSCFPKQYRCEKERDTKVVRRQRFMQLIVVGALVLGQFLLHFSFPISFVIPPMLHIHHHHPHQRYNTPI
jgi:hypothetical protein